MNKETRYWHQLEDGRIQCDVCPRFCRLREGQKGLCFVRACESGQIVLTTYGRSSGFCIDPIEKKPLYHFLPGSSVLSFGTAGCNLACRFCQNWDMSTSREMDILSEDASPETIAQAAKELGCRSVAMTYNDPTIFHEYAIDVAQACREVGIRSVAVTAGYVCPEPRIEFYRSLDAVNVDLKAFTEKFYYRLCSGHLEPVLDTLRYIKNSTEVWLEITNLLIPGENDGESELEAMTQWVVENLGSDVPMHFTAFHPEYKMMDHRSTQLETLQRARTIAMNNGVRFAYTGNVDDFEGSCTYCHHCETRLIGREGYELTHWGLTRDGCCSSCGTEIPGVFEAKAQRKAIRPHPVRIADFAAHGEFGKSNEG